MDTTKIKTETTITQLEPKTVLARLDNFRVGQRIATQQRTTITHTTTTEER